MSEKIHLYVSLPFFQHAVYQYKGVQPKKVFNLAQAVQTYAPNFVLQADEWIADTILATGDAVNFDSYDDFWSHRQSMSAEDHLAEAACIRAQRVLTTGKIDWQSLRGETLGQIQRNILDGTPRPGGIPHKMRDIFYHINMHAYATYIFLHFRGGGGQNLIMAVDPQDEEIVFFSKDGKRRHRI